ncbi:MAG: hypothetical protein QGG40_11510, partial [Myxococcota bacterium]|nr:hypothetical protein [Myxococcota bacterium]
TRHPFTLILTPLTATLAMGCIENFNINVPEGLVAEVEAEEADQEPEEEDDWYDDDDSDRYDEEGYSQCINACEMSYECQTLDVLGWPVEECFVGCERQFLEGEEVWLVEDGPTMQNLTECSYYADWECGYLEECLADYGVDFDRPAEEQDQDHDGIPDYEDDDVDGDGIPDDEQDRDEDGIPDYLDDDPDSAHDHEQDEDEDEEARDGTYVGSFTMDTQYFGILNDTCEGEVTLTISNGNIEGESWCMYNGMLQEFGDVVGGIWGAVEYPQAFGDLTMDNFGDIYEWSGDVDGDMLIGSFHGLTWAEHPAYGLVEVELNGHFTAENIGEIETDEPAEEENVSEESCYDTCSVLDECGELDAVDMDYGSCSTVCIDLLDYEAGLPWMEQSMGDVVECVLDSQTCEEVSVCLDDSTVDGCEQDEEPWCDNRDEQEWDGI